MAATFDLNKAHRPMEAEHVRIYVASRMVVALCRPATSISSPHRQASVDVEREDSVLFPVSSRSVTAVGNSYGRCLHRRPWWTNDEDMVGDDGDLWRRGRGSRTVEGSGGGGSTYDDAGDARICRSAIQTGATSIRSATITLPSSPHAVVLSSTFDTLLPPLRLSWWLCFLHTLSPHISSPRHRAFRSLPSGPPGMRSSTDGPASAAVAFCWRLFWAWGF
ncbi:hypothetical protein R3P38DRAFT_3221395 [Favolaschia claudopus]|uniref:Uncharacterized protein n=1 Tax=Favolaschia claudopus TaxID=2862362 RepID=A0AAW0A0J8_9AGAR